MTVFTLFIGSAPRSPSSPPVTEEKLLQLLTPLFPSFTIQHATGVFRGNMERTFVVKVTPRDVMAFIETVEALRQSLDQDGIGVELNGRYHRITQGCEHAGTLAHFYPRLRTEYFQTVFQTAKPKSGWPQSFAIVTAWNADGQPQDTFENERSDDELASRCSATDLVYWRVTGCSPDLIHAEDGYGIVTSLVEALALGRQYRQEAIYWVEGGQLSLVSCTHDIQVPLGEWEARLAN